MHRQTHATLHKANTVCSKIIRALVIIRIRKLIPNGVLWNKYASNHDLRLYTVFNKHDEIKIGDQNKEISQIVLQVLE